MNMSSPLRWFVTKSTLPVSTDPPTQPKITCGFNGTMTTLHCTASGPLVQYRWSGPGQEGATWSQEHTGPTFNSNSSDSVYTCVARNPVSERNQTIHSKECQTSGNLSKNNLVNNQIEMACICTVIAYC